MMKAQQTQALDINRPPANLPTMSQRELSGQSMDMLDTPCLVEDEDVLHANIKALQTFVTSFGLKLRPHAKSHKCPALAKQQLAAGAVGICCQKVSEAEVFAAEGIGDILIANEVVGLAKLQRLVRLHRRCLHLGGELIVCVDSARAAGFMNKALEQADQEQSIAPLSIYLEINVGQNRCVLQLEGLRQNWRGPSKTICLGFGWWAYRPITELRSICARLKNALRLWMLSATK